MADCWLLLHAPYVGLHDIHLHKYGCVCSAVLWTWHARRAENRQTSPAESCTARLAALGIAMPASSSSNAEVRLVPAAATAHVTAATASRRQLYASMSKQLNGMPLQVGERVWLQVHMTQP